MEIKKISSILNENILDEMDRKRKELEDKDKDNKVLDDQLRQRIADHKRQKEPVTKLDTEPDYNLAKTEIVDKIGEIIFYALREGNEEPLKEVEALIEKYAQYLKSKVVSPIASGDVKTYSDYAMPPRQDDDVINYKQ